MPIPSAILSPSSSDPESAVSAASPDELWVGDALLAEAVEVTAAESVLVARSEAGVVLLDAVDDEGKLTAEVEVVNELGPAEVAEATAELVASTAVLEGEELMAAKPTLTISCSVIDMSIPYELHPWRAMPAASKTADDPQLRPMHCETAVSQLFVTQRHESAKQRQPLQPQALDREQAWLAQTV